MPSGARVPVAAMEKSRSKGSRRGSNLSTDIAASSCAAAREPRAASAGAVLPPDRVILRPLPFSPRTTHVTDGPLAKPDSGPPPDTGRLPTAGLTGPGSHGPGRPFGCDTAGRPGNRDRRQTGRLYVPAITMNPPTP